MFKAAVEEPREIELEEILLIEEEPVSRPAGLAAMPKLAFSEPPGAK
jgi:hypothetical protein